MKVREAMAKAPVSLPADATVTEAARAMDTGAVGAIVVVDGERPVGIVTDRDLVVRGVARRLPPDARIDSVMSTDPVCVDADAELHSAVEALSSHPVRRIPVIDTDGRMVGMITLDDLIVRICHDLGELTRGVTAQLLFGHAEPQPPVPAG